VGDLIWKNTTVGEVTVLDRTVTGYPQGCSLWRPRRSAL